MCPLHARHRLRRRGERGPSSDKEGDPDVDAAVRVGSQTADLSFSFRTPRQPGEAPMDPDGSSWVQVRAALGKGGGGWGPAESCPHRGPAPLRPCPTEAPPHCSSTPLRPRPHSSSAPRGSSTPAEAPTPRRRPLNRHPAVCESREETTRTQLRMHMGHAEDQWGRLERGQCRRQRSGCLPSSLRLEAKVVISPPAEAPVLQGTCAGRGDVGTRRRKTSVTDWPRRHTRWTGAL